MPPRQLFLATVLFACTPALAQIPDDLTEPGQLPPSTGFADPDDISVLLDYRLPDWWSRVWTADVHMDGFASTYDGSHGSRRVANSFALDLATSARWEIEGERTQASYQATFEGDVAKNRSSSNNNDDHAQAGDASAEIDGRWRRYVSDRWSIVFGGRGAWSYAERLQEEGDDETWEFGRFYTTNLSVGIGYGRLRTVNPAIRAARLNERLVALGYVPLATADVLRLAEGLTRQSAYSNVFERPVRRFWADVLSPVTARGGLSPYEIYYLAEVLQENVGSRREGWQIDGAIGVGYAHDMSPMPDVEYWTIGPSVGAWWSHNFSLDHQFSARGAMAGSRRDPAGVAYLNRFDSATAELDLQYLWAVADRFLWSTELEVDHYYEESEWDAETHILRNLRGALSTSCSIYLEDRFALVPSVTCQYIESSSNTNLNINRGFHYALTFSYDLDNTLN